MESLSTVEFFEIFSFIFVLEFLISVSLELGLIFDFSGIDNTICTHGGLLTYRNRQIVSIQSPEGEDTEPDSMPMIPLRILLINTNVPKNTKIQVENVKKIATSSPNVSKHIFEAKKFLNFLHNKGRCRLLFPRGEKRFRMGFCKIQNRIQFHFVSFLYRWICLGL